VLVVGVLAASLGLSFYWISRILGALKFLRTRIDTGGVRTPIALMRTLMAGVVSMPTGTLLVCVDLRRVSVASRVHWVTKMG
jgi:hypothetical protein